MPVPALPAPLRFAALVGFVEALALAAYAVSIFIFETESTTSGISGPGADLAPGVLVTVYLLFALLIVGVTRMLLRVQRRGFTPFLMVQAFALVVAQTLVTAEATRPIGLVVIAVALLGLAGALAPSSRQALR